jgi:hypothetical protein
LTYLLEVGKTQNLSNKIWHTLEDASHLSVQKVCHYLGMSRLLHLNEAQTDWAATLLSLFFPFQQYLSLSFFNFILARYLALFSDNIGGIHHFSLLLYFYVSRFYWLKKCINTTE